MSPNPPMTWTAAVMSDDHLDPDSLVGRMLKPNATPWQEWPGGECPRCGYHDLEIQNTAEHGWATDGDPIRCRRCGLVGWMNVDAEDSCDEMFPADYKELPDDWESPPSPATVEPLPLWKMMHYAYWTAAGADISEDFPPYVPECIAAEIEALRDCIVPKSDPPFGEDWPDAYYRLRYAKWERDLEIHALLTEQAQIARGEP